MPGPSAKDPPPSSWANLYRLGTMGYELVLAIVVMGALGYLGDRLLPTRPWLLVSGLFLGIIVGMVRFMREAMALGGSTPRSGGTKSR